jgi:hypothetical protein
MTNRLEILKASLQKKEERFDSKLAGHFASVKQANGQPLNDKRNGSATLSKWEGQNDALRAIQDGIEVTKRAIEREESRIAAVSSVALPDAIRKMVDAGELVQWRKHPNCFFVAGVDRGRIVWDEQKQVVAHRYLREVPADQYPKFRDTYNGLRKALSS